MACMEHCCVDCGWATFNNKAHEPSSCPECGGDLIRSFDEDND